MKIVKFIKELIEEVKKDRAILEARRREAEVWNEAGRPTGPGADQSWRKKL